jgi:DNA-binding NtrC family response regulator
MLAVEEPGLADRLQEMIADLDMLVDTASSTERFWEKMARENYDLILISPSLLPEPTIDAIRSLRDLPDAPEVVAICPREDAEQRARFLAAGCLSVLNSRLPQGDLRDAMRAFLKRRRDVVEKALIGRPPLAGPQISDFVSASPAMQAFIKVVRRVVPTDTSLLITGETGVGKERLARAIHGEGHRSDGPFVAVNCGALPEALLESELFGHEEGAFTGAVRSRRGWFELAHRGTIFLDEIGEMPPHLQVKLLHVLQSREVLRVGSERPIPIDVRVMAATNRDLTQEVEAGRFRRDLYFRLGVVNLAIPPLRERREEVPALVERYLGYFRSQIPHEIEGITPDALNALIRYAWPGNVRELMNLIERAMLLCEGKSIDLVDLPDALREQATRNVRPAFLLPSESGDGGVPSEWLERPLRDFRRACVGDLERAYLAGLLKATGGKVGETARRAGIQPRSLYEKMRRHGLEKKDFRRRPPS